MLRARGNVSPLGPRGSLVWPKDQGGMGQKWQRQDCRGHSGQTERALKAGLGPGDEEAPGQDTSAPGRSSVSAAWRAQRRPRKEAEMWLGGGVQLALRERLGSEIPEPCQDGLETRCLPLWVGPPTTGQRWEGDQCSVA